MYLYSTYFQQQVYQNLVYLDKTQYLQAFRGGILKIGIPKFSILKNGILKFGIPNFSIPEKTYYLQAFRRGIPKFSIPKFGIPL
jgi:hypothetical protein